MKVKASVCTILASLHGFSNGFTSTSVPRISLDEYRYSPVHDRPVLIRDITSPALAEELVDSLMDACGDDFVTLQCKRKRNDGHSSTEFYDVTLQESVEYMMDSNHLNSYFAFCEGLLSTTDSACDSIENLQALTRVFESTRDKPFPNQENWFDLFPSNLKPSDAIILAGAGSTSTLHRDPFEWTGTSLCLEGTKIWRFIYPPPEQVGGVGVIDHALKSYRLDSVAWEQDGDATAVLSAGWQSDMSLYATIDEQFPSAFEWMKREEENASSFRNEIESKASMLYPDSDASQALERIISDSKEASFGTAVQSIGDLLLIPAHCWHQTYAPVPSVAIASQRCSAAIDGANVVRHVIDLSRNSGRVPDVLKQTTYSEGDGKQIVDELLSFALK